ncbi:MAG TPA: hypothetical protein DCL04_04305 [Synergistaceae bacterium]|nr:hypothetical protein [Synergistaceae bacterium]
MALVAQEFLEQEVTDFLGRGHYEQSEDDTHGYRNGYEPRSLKTAEDKTTVFVPHKLFNLCCIVQCERRSISGICDVPQENRQFAVKGLAWTIFSRRG